MCKRLCHTLPFFAPLFSLSPKLPNHLTLCAFIPLTPQPHRLLTSLPAQHPFRHPCLTPLLFLPPHLSSSPAHWSCSYSISSSRGSFHGANVLQAPQWRCAMSDTLGMRAVIEGKRLSQSSPRTSLCVPDANYGTCKWMCGIKVRRSLCLSLCRQFVYVCVYRMCVHSDCLVLDTYKYVWHSRNKSLGQHPSYLFTPAVVQLPAWILLFFFFRKDRMYEQFFLFLLSIKTKCK